MFLLHLSDVHVCAENQEQFATICDSIINALQLFPDGSIKPEMLLFTGDYTHHGSIEEFTYFRRIFEEKLKDPIFQNIEKVVMVPGNHDYPWSDPGRREINFKELEAYFRNSFGEKALIDDSSLQEKLKTQIISHAYNQLATYRVLLIGMNSMKIDSEERKGIGYFDNDQLHLVREIVEYYRRKNTTPLYVFVAFHHHLLPVSFVERDTLEEKNKYSLTLDARRAIDTFLDCGVQFALHGHQHQPSMLTLMDDSGKHMNKCLHIISCGCLADRERLNDSGRRSFILYEINEGYVKAFLAETSREDSDRFEWETPVVYKLEKLSIDKKRIRDWAEKDNRWVNQVDDATLSIDNEIENVSITDLVDTLVDGIRDDGSVAYYAGKDERYRTSTLATVLECIYECGLLPMEDAFVMQQKLMRLRDNKEDVIRISEADDVIDKDAKDEPAWGLDEAPSVWTTSKALTALFVTHYIPQSREEEIKIRDSVTWLAQQQYSSGGWGYQFYKDSEVCNASVPMTALALRALCLSLDNDYIKLNNGDITQIYNAIKKGAKRLLNTLDKSKKYWTYKGKPNLSASIWALQALDQAEVVLRSSTDFSESGRRIQNGVKAIEKQVIEYVIAHLPSEDNSDAITETFFDAPAGSSLKYKPNIARKKEFKSFTPYVLSYLLKYDPNCAEKKEIKAMIKWVLNHKDTRWLIEDFNGETGNPCLISIAMSINIIVNWLQEISNRAVTQAITSL